MTRWTERKIIEYNMNRNCECGNHCYTIVGGESGKYEVEWAHPPGECPYDCEDCGEEAAE